MLLSTMLSVSRAVAFKGPVAASFVQRSCFLARRARSLRGAIKSLGPMSSTGPLFAHSTHSALKLPRVEGAAAAKLTVAARVFFRQPPSLARVYQWVLSGPSRLWVAFRAWRRLCTAAAWKACLHAALVLAWVSVAHSPSFQSNQT